MKTRRKRDRQTRKVRTLLYKKRRFLDVDLDDDEDLDDEVYDLGASTFPQDQNFTY
jgi:hypothetical protein